MGYSHWQTLDFNLADVIILAIQITKQRKIKR